MIKRPIRITIKNVIRRRSNDGYWRWRNLRNYGRNGFEFDEKTEKPLLPSTVYENSVYPSRQRSPDAFQTLRSVFDLSVLRPPRRIRLARRVFIYLAPSFLRTPVGNKRVTA